MENPAGQIVYCVCGKMTQQQCMENWGADCDDLPYVRGNPVNSNSNVAHQGKPLVKELSEYEELLRKNNSENSR